ncbi:MAG: hypothetical protein GYA12_01935 [Chloroflexi bacterium]|nr:hypothetical protein [Chloroflexota bacterium]
MTQFIAITPNAEVNGETILSIVSGMGSLKTTAYQILENHGISNPVPGRWYPQQAWLDSFKVIARTYRPVTLICIGRKIPENAIFPPEINTIEKALAAIEVAYHMNHRIDGRPLFDPSTGEMREGIGHYTFQSLGTNKAAIICDNPYPCDFDRGIVDEMAFMYKPAASRGVTITHTDDSLCRNDGGEVCTYIVEW